MKFLSPIGREPISLRTCTRKLALLAATLIAALCTQSYALAADAPPAEPSATAAAAEMQTRLAEMNQSLSRATAERDQLSSQLAAEQAERAKTEDALAALKSEREQMWETLSQTKASLEEAKQSVGRVTAERDELSSQLSAGQAERDKVSGVLEQYRATLGETKQNLASVTAERDSLKAELGQAQQAQEQLRSTLDQTESKIGSLSNDIEALQTGLPKTLGGSATLQDLQEAAGESADELRAIHKMLRKNPGDSALKEKNHSIVLDLREKQLLVASATGAGGLYQLRPEDALAMVALRFYGDGNQWPQIFEANEHVLENPDKLIPGLTLVVP